MPSHLLQRMGEETIVSGGAADILGRLVGFFDLLRSRGVPVGIGSELDLARALEHVSPLDRDGFRSASRCTLAKSPADLAILDEAFDQYWLTGPNLDVSPEASRPSSVSRPSTDARGESLSTPAMPTGTMVPIAIRVGVYSPDAPPGGHPLSPIDPRQLAALRAGARRLRRMVASLPGRRSAASRRGRVDLHRTLRRAGRTAGELVDLRHSRKRHTRAELVVLWDVSGSMRDHDAVLAGLVYNLCRVVRNTRVFAFSTEVRELTRVLAGVPYKRSLVPLALALGPAGGGTRIGVCLREFRRGFGRTLHPWTTVLILSDGWDLGDSNLLAGELAVLHKKAHRIAWVNPHARTAGFRPETAAMERSLPQIDLFLAPSDFESARAIGLGQPPRRLANR